MTNSRRKRSTRLSAAAALLAASLPVHAAPAAPEAPAQGDSYLADWAVRLTQELEGGPLRLPTEAELRDMGRQVEAYLDTGSLDEFAWVLPEAREAMAVCDTLPELKPYADWLRQRMDYLELASSLVRLYPPQKPLPPPLKPNPHARFSLPKPPAPPPVTSAMLQKREQAVRSRATWRKALSNRPVPESGPKLVPVLKKVFLEEGLPHQLVWIAEVESSFNPEARSPSGAVGLFQLMPETAARLGLRTHPVDQRTSTELNTRAAARYLRFLYDEFGSWPLAIAGYNAGEGRVGRALDQVAKPSFDAIAPDLPMQTRLYVPKVMTLIELREKADVASLPAPKPEKP